jgi:CCR4-NOT transcriptional regulation complex NOT5 subunit
MASKELKKRNWLFNKKHCVWFKLHEKSEREQNYLVFDKNEWRVKRTHNLEISEAVIAHDM